MKNIKNNVIAGTVKWTGIAIGALITINGLGYLRSQKTFRDLDENGLRAASYKYSREFIEKYEKDANRFQKTFLFGNYLSSKKYIEKRE